MEVLIGKAADPQLPTMTRARPSRTSYSHCRRPLGGSGWPCGDEGISDAKGRDKWPVLVLDVFKDAPFGSLLYDMGIGSVVGGPLCDLFTNPPR